MGLLLLLMGVGIPAAPPEGSGGSPGPQIADPSADIGPVDDETSAPGGSPAPVDTEVPPAPADIQPGPAPIGLYTGTGTPIAVAGAVTVTHPAARSVDEEPAGNGMPQNVRAGVQGSSLVGAAPKRVARPGGDVVPTGPAAALGRPTDEGHPETAKRTGVVVQAEHGVPLGHEASIADLRPGAAPAHRDPAYPPPVAAAAPASPEPPNAGLDTRPPAWLAATAATAAGQSAASVPSTPVSITPSPDASRDATATPTPEPTTVRHFRVQPGATARAANAIDHGADRQPSLDRQASDSPFASTTPHPYVGHALSDGGAAHSIAPSTRAEPPIAAAAPPVVDQIVHAARLVVNEGMTQMDVQLEPPTLGAVRVSAAATADSIGLTLTAERPETRALLEQAIPQIQAALSARGVTATSIAVTANFDPPDARRAPLRREADRGDRSGRDSRERQRPGNEPRPVGLVNLTV